MMVLLNIWAKLLCFCCIERRRPKKQAIWLIHPSELTASTGHGSGCCGCNRQTNSRIWKTQVFLSFPVPIALDAPGRQTTGLDRLCLCSTSKCKSLFSLDATGRKTNGTLIQSCCSWTPVFKFLGCILVLDATGRITTELDLPYASFVLPGSGSSGSGCLEGTRPE